MIFKAKWRKMLMRSVRMFQTEPKCEQIKNNAFNYLHLHQKFYYILQAREDDINEQSTDKWIYSTIVLQHGNKIHDAIKEVCLTKPNMKISEVITWSIFVSRTQMCAYIME